VARDITNALARKDTRTAFRLASRAFPSHRKRISALTTPAQKEQLIRHYHSVLAAEAPASASLRTIFRIMPPSPHSPPSTIRDLPARLSVTVATDGSATSNAAGWGLVTDNGWGVFGRVSCQHPLTPTNNRAEIQAVLAAMMLGAARVHIITDSMIVVHGLASLRRSHRNGFHNIPHGDLWQRIAILSEHTEVTAQHCNSHQPHTPLGNRMADILAAAGRLAPTPDTRVVSLPTDHAWAMPHRRPDGSYLRELSQSDINAAARRVLRTWPSTILPIDFPSSGHPLPDAPEPPQATL
jgi:ribonuclease HI